ncbi:MAG: SUMF1/EgtB/PvdO family nonheme iron enzyme [Salinivirgaceae bacterium]|nr:SUMF1/EgtB/PvdO family nonheme iron enzyme [Salinivirgaceae bacterium]
MPVPYAMYAHRTTTVIQPAEASEEPIFEINDSNGNPMFAVYETGVKVFVDYDDESKAAKSKFAVAGVKKGKADNENLLTIDGSGTIVYVDDNNNPNGKAAKSKFAVSGLKKGKERVDLLTIDGSGSTIYVDDSDNQNGKAAKSKFAVSGLKKGKERVDLFTIDGTGSTVYVDDSDIQNGKAAKSKFAVSGLKKGKERVDLLTIDGTGSTIYIDDDENQNGKAAKSKFAVAGRPSSKDGSSQAENMFTIDDDGSTIYVDFNYTDKAAKSKFAVAGRRAKGVEDVVTIDGDKATFYVDIDENENCGKAAKSKFAVAGRPSSKDESVPYFIIDQFGSLIYIDDDENQNGKAAKSKFAVAGVKKGKGDTFSYSNSFMTVEDDSTRIYINDEVVQETGSFASNFAIVSMLENADLMMINRDSAIIKMNLYESKELYNATGTVERLYVTVKFADGANGKVLGYLDGKLLGDTCDVMRGTVIKLETQPNSGYSLLAWSDGSIEPEHYVTINTDTVFSAEFISGFKFSGTDSAWITTTQIEGFDTDYKNFLSFSEVAVDTIQLDERRSVNYLLYDSNGNTIDNEDDAVAIALRANDTTFIARALKPFKGTVAFGLRKTDGDTVKIDVNLDSKTGLWYNLPEGDFTYGAVTLEGNMSLSDTVTLTATAGKDKIFGGWKTTGPFEANIRGLYNKQCKYPLIYDIIGTTIEPVFAEPVLYVADAADSSNTGFSASEPMPSIDMAVSKIIQLQLEKLNWTIYVDGVVKGWQTIPGEYVVEGTTDVLEAKDYIDTLLLTGINGATIDAGWYYDEDAWEWVNDYADYYNSYEGASALTINTAAPVVISNLAIIRGYKYDSGGGIFVDNADGDVTLASGSVVSENTASCGGGICFGGKKLTIGNGAEISYNTAYSQGGGLYGDGCFAEKDAYGNFKKDADDKVEISGGGKVIIDDGALITHNTIDDGEGAGVYMASGTLTINKAEISHNLAVAGGGLRCSSKTEYDEDGNSFEHSVNVTMNGASIIDNTCSYCDEADYGGGGVCIGGKVMFEMNDGVIARNVAAGYGGGVCMLSGANFIMGNDAADGDPLIDSNKSTDGYAGLGGGVFVKSGSTFTMKNGTISNNASQATKDYGAQYYYGGGGACVMGTFNMEGGAIINNSAVCNGGGVEVANQGTLSMTGGTIAGNSCAESGSGVHLTNNYYYLSSFGTLIVGGTALIAQGNDVGLGYYSSGSTVSMGSVEISATLENANVATITPGNYDYPFSILESNIDNLLAAEYGKFSVTPHNDGGTLKLYTLTSEGKLQERIDLVVLPAYYDYNESGHSVLEYLDEISITDGHITLPDVPTKTPVEGCGISYQPQGWFIKDANNNFVQVDNSTEFTASTQIYARYTADTTVENSAAQLSDVLRYMNDPLTDYTINIKGTLYGPQEITTDAVSPHSIVLKGESDGKVDGGWAESNVGWTYSGAYTTENDTAKWPVLIVNTSVPLTIENLTICGGDSIGIYCVPGSNLTLGNGALVTGNGNGDGLGVYVADDAMLAMGGSARVDDNNPVWLDAILSYSGDVLQISQINVTSNLTADIAATIIPTGYSLTEPVLAFADQSIATQANCDKFAVVPMKGATYKINLTTAPDGNYGMLQQTAYGVTFYMDFGDQLDETLIVETLTVEPDNTIPISKVPNVTRDHYHFLNWYKVGYTSDNFPVPDDEPFDFENEAITSNTILVGQWEQFEAVVVFKNDYYDETPYHTEVVDLLLQSPKVQKPADPTMDGYGFTNWYRFIEYDEKNGVVRLENNPFNFDQNITGDIMLIATWERLLYVSEKEPTNPDAELGSEANPFPTIADAISRINKISNSYSATFAIVVDGMLTLPQRITGYVTAGTITIKGKHALVDGVPQDGINLTGDTSGKSALYVGSDPDDANSYFNSSLEVVLKNLKLTGAVLRGEDNDSKGALSVWSGYVTLSDGLLITNNKYADGVTEKGSGAYFGLIGRWFIEGSAKVTEDNDVYVAINVNNNNGALLYVMDVLTAKEPVITITPANYEASLAWVRKYNSVPDSIRNEFSKIAVSDAVVGGEYTSWVIDNSDGTLQRAARHIFYDIAYENPGSLDEDASRIIKAAVYGTLTPPDPAPRDGYIFAGWCELLFDDEYPSGLAEGITDFSTYTVPDPTVRTFFAKWTQTTNGGTTLYVAPNASDADDNYDGTDDSQPLKTFYGALLKMTDSEMDYTVILDGDGSEICRNAYDEYGGLFNRDGNSIMAAYGYEKNYLEINSEFSASSITIDGGGSTISGQYDNEEQGTVFVIATETPVTFKNLTINGACAAVGINGGCIRVGAASTVVLAEGVYLQGGRTWGGKGAGVYVAADGTLIMKGNAVAEWDEEGSSDIYLESGAVITIGSQLTGKTSDAIPYVAMISPAVYTEGVQVLKLATDGEGQNISGTELANEVAKFTVAKQKMDELGNELDIPIEWYVDPDGCLTKTKPNNGGGTMPEGFTEVAGGTISKESYNVGWNDNESEGDNMTIPSLLVCNHLVSQYEYEQLMTYYGAVNTAHPELQPSETTAEAKKNTPAYYVSWFDAIIYCNLLSMAEDKEPVYSIDGVTDPTSETWRYRRVAQDGDKYYYNDISQGNGLDSDGGNFKFDFSHSGYRLLTSAEFNYLLLNNPDLITNGNYDEWCNNYDAYSEGKRIWFNGTTDEVAGVDDAKINYYRAENFGFRIVRKPDTNP